MKKYFLKFLTLVLTTLILIPNVKADRGELRYEVTKLNVKENKITFKGYAFIHKTNNFVTIEELDANGNKTGKVLKRNGGQEICIRAISNNNVIEEQCFTGMSEVDNKNFNFYCQMYFHSGNGKDIECKSSVYNGTYNYFPSYFKGKDNVDSNTCDINNDGSQCYYEDIGFSVTFDVSSWKNVSEDTDIHFEIRAKNNDYGKYTAYEELFIREKITNSLTSNFIEYKNGSLSNKVKFIAYPAWLTDLDGSTNTCIGDLGKVYMTTEYTEPTSNTITFLRKTYSPGKYKIKTNNSTNNGQACSPGNEKTIRTAWGSWVKPTGDLSFTIKVKNDKKCKVVSPGTGKAVCNGSGNLKSTCDELTVRTNSGSAVVKIEQTGIITSILTPDRIHAGGGFKFGVMYYNTLKWSYVKEPSSQTVKKEVEQVMNDKIKNLTDFTSNLNFSNLKFDKDVIEDGFIQKKCIDSGSFTEGNTLTTTCTFFLPETILKDYTGEVDKINYIGSINNVYYTPMNFNGIYNITGKLENMSRITNNSAKTDSKDKNKPWTGDWNIELTDCNLDVYSLLTNKPTPYGNPKFKFIYRPININNPFPNKNRVPGVNWYDWYNDTNNKEKLKETYTKLQYQIKIDNEKLANIKSYNKNKNYLEWDRDTFVNGESKFIEDYFNVYRKNIVGDER